jgi:hypothetical protein
MGERKLGLFIRDYLIGIHCLFISYEVVKQWNFFSLLSRWGEKIRIVYKRLLNRHSLSAHFLRSCKTMEFFSLCYPDGERKLGLFIRDYLIGIPYRLISYEVVKQGNISLFVTPIGRENKENTIGYQIMRQSITQ